MSRRTFRVYAYALALLSAVCVPASSSAEGQTAPAVAHLAPTPVGTISAAQTITIPVYSAGIAADIAIAPADATEFQIVAGGPCAAGQTYAAGDSCTVVVAFGPTAPGTAAGAVQLRGSDGHLLGTARFRGTGLGAAAAFTPGLVQTVSAQPQSTLGFSAVTSARGGQAYLADASSGQLLRVDVQAGTTTVVATALPPSGPVTAMAADADGTLYLAQASGIVSRIDGGAGRLTRVDFSNVPGDTSSGPTAISVDQEGHLLLALHSRVLRLQHGTWTALTGATACADATAACGDGDIASHAAFNNIIAIAEDASGSLLVADAAEFRIRRIDAKTGQVSTVAGTGAACTHGSCGDHGLASSARLGLLSGMAVDPLGNIYIAEQQGSGLRRIDAATGTITSILPATETRFRSGAVHLATMRDGSVLLLAATDPTTVARFSASSAALAFAKTNVGQTSTDSVQAVTLSNLGNAPLAMATPAAGTNPSTTADFPLSNTQTCPQLSTSSAAQTLAPGQSCSVEVKFTPTAAGNISSKVVLSEAAAAAAPVTHSIAVQGIAAPPTAQANLALSSQSPPVVYGQPVTLTATVSSSSNPAPTGTVTFSEGSNDLAANVGLTSGSANYKVLIPSSGTHTYAVSYSGDNAYAASAQNATLDITVARAASVFTISVPTYQYGQNIHTAFSLSGQYAGTGIALPSGIVTFTLLDSGGNTVVTGAASHASRVGSIDENAQIGTLGAGTYTFRISYPGDTNFLPLQQDYVLPVQRVGQTITFAPIASPVTYGTPPISLSAVAYTGTPATATGLPVTFTVLSGPGNIVNNQLVVTGVGTIVVAADQPGDSNYTAAPRVTQTVVSVAPMAKLTWATPAPIPSGTPLSATQLNASATNNLGQPVSGTYTYTPSAGTVLPVGNTTLNVSFAPSDTTLYGTTPLTASVALTVRDPISTPTITFAGGSVPFGGSITPALNATATSNGSTVPGTFVYTNGGSALTASTSLPVGTYTVTATFTPSDSNRYRGGSATATVTVTRAVTTIGLTSSTSPVLLSSPVTFTAKVAGGTATPTGTVQFTTGSTALGSATIGANGIATLSVSTLPAGSQTVTAIYSGDSNFSGASAMLTEVVGDFTLARNSSSAATQAALPGKIASWQFTVAPTVTANLISDVSFTVTGLPTGATYTVTPPTVAAGSGATTVILAITAPATLKSRIEGPLWHGKAAAIVAALLLLPFGARLRRGSSRLQRAGVLATILFACAMLLTASGCGTGVGYFDQAQATIPVTLSANSGPLSHTASISLEVQ